MRQFDNTTMKTIIQTLLIFLFFCALYISTAPTTNVSYADSDLMITIGHFAGVAHPPGYPIYMFLVFLITHLPIAGTIAFRAHVLSSVLHALTLSVIYVSNHLLASHLISNTKNKLNSKIKTYLPSFVGLLSTCALGFSYLFWLYSSVAEKYPLNDLFAALIFYLVIKITVSQNQPSNKYWYILSFVFALSISHHHSILMLLPMLLLLAWQNRQTFLQTLRFTIPIFLTTYLFTVVLLLFLNTNPSPVSWHFAPTIKGLYTHLTRREFTGYNIVQGEYRGIYLDPVTPSEIITKIPIYIDLLLKHFGFIPIILMAFGLYLFPKLDSKISKLFITAFLSTTVFIPMYVDWPNDLSIQSLRIRMYLLGYVVIPIFISISLLKISTHILENQKLSNQFKKIIIAAIALIIAGRSVFIHPQVYLKNTTYISSLYTNILTSVPENSLVACISDVSCFALFYSHYVENIRGDVTILPHGTHLVEHSFPKDLDLKGFDYKNNPEKFIDYLTWNLDKKNVYIVELQKIYSELLGINYGFLYYVPNGYYGQLVKQKPTLLPNSDSSLSEEIAKLPVPSLDHSRLQFRAQLMQKHLLNALTYAKLRVGSSLVERELELARGLIGGLPDIYAKEVVEVDKLLASPQEYQKYLGNINSGSREQILRQASIYSDQNQTVLALVGINSILYQNPKDSETRFFLAKFYEKNGQTQKALEELANILKYNPTYQPALTFRDQLLTDTKY